MQPDPELEQQLIRFGALWESILRLKTGWGIGSFPEELAQLKERLGRLHVDDSEKRASEYDLFYRIGVVLAHQNHPQSMGELSNELTVPLSTATRMVDWLVESGYAQRLSDPADRRVVRVALTDTGRELYQACQEFVQQRAARLLGRFTPEERSELIVLLAKLVQAMEERGA